MQNVAIFVEALVALYIAMAIIARLVISPEHIFAEKILYKPENILFEFHRQICRYDKEGAKAFTEKTIKAMGAKEDYLAKKALLRKLTDLYVRRSPDAIKELADFLKQDQVLRNGLNKNYSNQILLGFYDILSELFKKMKEPKPDKRIRSNIQNHINAKQGRLRLQDKSKLNKADIKIVEKSEELGKEILRYNEEKPARHKPLEETGILQAETRLVNKFWEDVKKL